jgi:hypothetical protein
MEKQLNDFQQVLKNDPLIQELEQTLAQMKGGIPSKKSFPIRDADELAQEGRHLPELKQLFGNYILEGSAVLFPSERGVGKTFFLMQICLAVSKGFYWFLNEPIQLHGNTIYLDFELGERAFKRRLATLYEGLYHAALPAAPFKTLVVNAQGGLSKALDTFTGYVDQYKPVLVVVDNLRTAFREVDHDKNSAMVNVIAGLMDLKNEKGFALVVAHHTKKNTSGTLTHSDLQSGAGAISDLFDADFFLRRSGQDKDLRLLIRKKSRFCEEANGAKLIKLDPEKLWFEFLADEVEESEHLVSEKASGNSRENQDGKDEAIARLLAENKPWKQIEAQLGVSSKRVARVKASLSTFPLSSIPSQESVLSAQAGKESEESGKEQPPF